jgi:NAD(P)-dependent dehydrogenase (short-subunit alcohol dehydrogenase family)
MLRLLEEITVARSCEDAYTYIRDFTTTREWDSTAIDAEKLSAGEIAEGTEFRVRCAMPLGSVVLNYTVEALDENSRIELRGEGTMFSVVDTITLQGEGDYCRIRYQADFYFKPWLEPFEQRFASGLQRMGKASVEGLRAALEDPQPLLQNSRCSSVADRLILPGMHSFTALGFKKSRQRFRPISANMRGRHVVLTGASSGIGYAAATRLAEMGASLTLVMRNSDKAAASCKTLQTLSGNKNIKAELADMSSLADIDALAERLLAKGRPIDVLINNAGALLNERQETAEGYEYSLALLLLAPYRLTLALRPLLQDAPNARVVNVVSGGLYTQRLDLKKLFLDDPEKYNGSAAYAQAKRALMLATGALSRRWLDDGIVVNAMHPGWADTPGVEDSLPLFHKITRPFLRDAAQGADTIVWLAAAEEASAVSGKLFLDRQPRQQYLLPGTREALAERQELMQILDQSLYESPGILAARIKDSGKAEATPQAS